MKKQKFDKKQRTQALSNLKEAADAAVAGAGDTVDLSSGEGEDKILDADDSDNSDVENNNAEENQAVEDEDVNDKKVNEDEDAFEGNEGKDKQEHDTMDVVVQTCLYLVLDTKPFYKHSCSDWCYFCCTIIVVIFC